MPKYTNKFYYFNLQNGTSEYSDAEEDYKWFRILCYISDILFVFSWIIASVYNKAGIEGMDFDPESDSKTNKQNNPDAEGERTGLVEGGKPE